MLPAINASVLGARPATGSTSILHFTKACWAGSHRQISGLNRIFLNMLLGVLPLSLAANLFRRRATRCDGFWIFLKRARRAA
jgi:uncharacterized membrane protein